MELFSQTWPPFIEAPTEIARGTLLGTDTLPSSSPPSLPAAATTKMPISTAFRVTETDGPSLVILSVCEPPKDREIISALKSSIHQLMACATVLSSAVFLPVPSSPRAATTPNLMLGAMPIWWDCAISNPDINVPCAKNP